MKLEKIEIKPIYNIVGLTEKQFMVLRALINNTGDGRNKRIIEERYVWEDYMTEEEALEMACEVETVIWEI